MKWRSDRGELVRRVDREAGPSALRSALFAVAVAAVLAWGSWTTLASGGESVNDFDLALTPPTQDVCVPEDAVYSVDVASLGGFMDPVTLSAMGNPAGTTTNFDINPVIPPGVSSLTIGNMGAATAGLYDIEVVGVAPTSTHTVTARLGVFDAAPGVPTLVAPANGSTGQLRAPRLAWTSANANDYEVQIALDAGFGTIVYDQTVGETAHSPEVALAPFVEHFWRIRALNPCGPGTFSGAFSFTTGTSGQILLVDDDDDVPDVASLYESALANLGFTFDIFDTERSDVEPSAALMTLYPAVVWFSGDSFTSPAGTGVAGPGAAGEAALSDYFDGGGCLFLSSQDYLWDHGLTAFGGQRLGIAAYTSDVTQTVVTGQGLFGGLGPYTLVYPFSNFSDRVVPAISQELAFDGDVADAAVTHGTGGYRSTFLGFSWVALPTALDREDVLSTALAACEPIFADGFESGDTSAWSNSVP